MESGQIVAGNKQVDINKGGGGIDQQRVGSKTRTEGLKSFLVSKSLG